jgi:prolyl 4-hydroxylase
MMIPPETSGQSPTIEVEVLSLDPRVYELVNFFDLREADALIEKALNDTSETHGLHRSTTGATNGQVFSKRTSDNAWDVNGMTAKRVKRRCFEVLGFDQFYESHADGLQILRYQNTQAYTTHDDYLDNSARENYDYDTAGVGGNRFATVLMYLSTPELGGETMFKNQYPIGTLEQDRIPLSRALADLRETEAGALLKQGSWEEELTAYCRSRLAVKPSKGRAVLFYSQHPNGAQDHMAYHGACPVLQGTKWAANLWVWSAPRHEWPYAPRIREETEEEKKKRSNPNALQATFRNTGKDPKLNEAKLWYEDQMFFGDLGPNDKPITVNTYVSHKWNIRVGDEVVKSYDITTAGQDLTFDI